MKLVTIAFSHYNERARWALDRFGVEYRERGYLPVFHFGGVLAAAGFSGGRADRASSRFSTPMLVRPNASPLRDSGAIVRFVDGEFSTPQTTLYPPEHRAEIDEIERLAHDHIGPHTRRIAYFYLLNAPAAMRSLVRTNVGTLQAWSYLALMPLAKLALHRALAIDEPHTIKSRKVLATQLAALGQRLGSRRYLVGDRFSAADLAVASLLSPLVVPAEFGASFPDEDTVPSEFRELVEQTRETVIGRYALRIYAQERSVDVRGPSGTTEQPSASSASSG